VIALVHAEHYPERVIGVQVRHGRVKKFLVNYTNFLGSLPGERADFFIRDRRPGKSTARAYSLRGYTIPEKIA